MPELVRGATAPDERGSATSCTSVGQTQAGQKLDYYCFTRGNDGYDWDCLKDLATGRQPPN